MAKEEAGAFDAVMLDVMSALIALPAIGVANSGDETRIKARQPQFERIPQIEPDLLALDRFLARLEHKCVSATDARVFSRARKNVRRMLSALPMVLPTVSAKR
ncbi:MAG TPA: hypothetical protein VML19_05485 [Verrucomicrobiae bacterium]|nr:hypothetical protein [Verrucomicrobiae bacterium]